MRAAWSSVNCQRRAQLKSATNSKSLWVGRRLGRKCIVAKSIDQGNNVQAQTLNGHFSALALLSFLRLTAFLIGLTSWLLVVGDDVVPPWLILSLGPLYCANVKRRLNACSRSSFRALVARQCSCPTRSTSWRRSKSIYAIHRSARRQKKYNIWKKPRRKVMPPVHEQQSSIIVHYVCCKFKVAGAVPLS